MFLPSATVPSYSSISPMMLPLTTVSTQPSGQNFIKTGNPNIDSLLIKNSTIEWKPYTSNEHNYIFFQLNNIHNELNYFDSMYNFWIKFFQTELNGGCHKELIIMKIKKHIGLFLIILFVLLIFIIIYFICKRYRKNKKNNIEH
ncbi:unnamed protein product [Rotaria sp. Silwood1]|nr:unnamed protein product [Rotaria sp. Silwood1]